MKATSEWQEADVQRMIDDRIEENLRLDYKDCRAFSKTDDKKKEAIGIAVSAFANSLGGVILYGVQEDQDHHLPEKIEGLNPVEFKKEWLEEIINARISKRIEGIVIYPIPLSGANTGKVVYAVEVPESPLAPHQASDYRYYKRHNFQCLPMEDYEVRDVANRRRNPIVRPYLTLNGAMNRLGVAGYEEGTLSLIIKNEGQILAEKIYLELFMPQKAVGRNNKFPVVDRDNLVLDGQDYSVFKYIRRDASGLLPLFPGASALIFDGNYIYLSLGFQGTWFQDNTGLSIKCKVFADYATPQEISVTLFDLVPQAYKELYPIRVK